MAQGVTAWRGFLAAFTLDRLADMLWTSTLVWIAATVASPTQQGLVIAAALIPQAVVLLFGGAAADAWGSVRVTTLTTVLKAGLLGVLAASMSLHDNSLVFLALIAALIGSVDGFHDPAIESWGARLRNADEQMSAAAMETTLWRGAQVSGSALAGLLLGINLVVPLLAITALYLAQRVVLAIVAKRDAADSTVGIASAGLNKQISEGFAFLRSQPVLWATMGVQTVSNLTTGAALMLLMPLIVRDRGWSPWVYGLTATGFTLGLMGGVVASRRIEASARELHKIPLRAFACAAAAHVVPVLIILFRPDVGILGFSGLFLLFGLFLGAVAPLLSGYRRALTPRRQQGVLAATARLIVLTPEPLGPLIVGFVVGAYGLSVGLWAIAAAGLVAPTAGALWLRRLSRLSLVPKV